ncbi:MAG: aspartate aminotransferase, partial [Flavobacteriales bacterium CG11_big_fil_rev_8_21_14_0_20_35_7]
MNHLISDRINNFPVSATLAMAAKARALNEQGKNIISLSLGEPDFNTPDFIKDAAKQAIDDNYSSYSPVNGYLDLRQAICHKFKRDNNLTYTADQIVVSTGAKQSLSNIVMALVNPGDEVLLPAPYWVSYDAMVNMAEGISIEIPSTVETDFKITPAQLEAAITPKTKLVFFNSPNNPSGTVYSKAEYRALADVLAKHPNIFIISDEIYEHIIYKGTAFSFAAFEDM